ncbi:MAG: DJ-1/PfpI family protein [Pseudomonadota bacterium]
MTKRFMIIALWTFLAPTATLGTELTKSWPQQGAVLDDRLKSIHLWFDDVPDARAAEIEISGASAELAIRGLHGMGSNDLMGLVEGSMPDGDYVLSWRLPGSEGDIEFQIRRPAGHQTDVWEPPLDIGIVLYDGVEPLDVMGPLEMWMNAGPDNIRVHLIAESAGPVVLTTTSYPPALAPRVDAPWSFDDHPDLDVLMVPGGIGTLVEMDNPAMIDFLKRATQEVAVATSVCTGSGLLAKAGVLQGVGATGNKAFFDYLVSQGEADWQAEARWVESGRFFTSSGVSAGMDMSLAVVARFFGLDIARMIASSTEYVWNEDAALDPFIGNLNTAVPWVDYLRESFEPNGAAE